MTKNQYQIISDYKMTKDEAFAFKLCCLYVELSKRYFPDYKHRTLPKGDPTKSWLFKHCWKLALETKDKLNISEYRFYIQAQMSILKNIRIGDGHPYIDPNCLVGKSAWKRWEIWKKYFNEVKKTAEIIPHTEDFTRAICKALRETHYALKVRLGELSAEKIKEEMPFIIRLCDMNVITPYFLLLSPTAQKYIMTHNSPLDFDARLCMKHINEDVKRYYAGLFKDV